MNKVVHCKKEPFDVLIDRRTKWGNPFVIGKDGTREEVISKYDAWLPTQPDLMASLHELKGKTLGCWCAPNACHGDVLIKHLKMQEIKEQIQEVAARRQKIDEQYDLATAESDRAFAEIQSTCEHWVKKFYPEDYNTNRGEYVCQICGKVLDE